MGPDAELLHPHWRRDTVWVEALTGKIELCPGFDFCERTWAWEAEWAVHTVHGEKHGCVMALSSLPYPLERRGNGILSSKGLAGVSQEATHPKEPGKQSE